MELFKKGAGQPSVCVFKDGMEKLYVKAEGHEDLSYHPRSKCQVARHGMSLAGDQRRLWVLPFVSIPLRLQFSSFYSHSKSSYQEAIFCHSSEAGIGHVFSLFSYIFFPQPSLSFARVIFHVSWCYWPTICRACTLSFIYSSDDELSLS